MLRMTTRLLVLAALLLSGVCAEAAAQQRLALVVGVDRYENLPPDQNPAKAVRDARAIGAALETLGFDVEIAENIDRSDFYRAWRRFVTRVRPGDMATLYFSGLGVEQSGVNYLLPSDTPGEGNDSEQVLRDGSINLHRLYEDLHLRMPQAGLVIVDACRRQSAQRQSGQDHWRCERAGALRSPQRHIRHVFRRVGAGVARISSTTATPTRIRCMSAPCSPC